MRELNSPLRHAILTSAFFLLLASCGPESSSNALGEAYVAPATLNLHSNLSSKSTTVAVLKHGDHLTVVDVKRKYVKVRTAKGVEGWLDSRQLLSKEQMTQLRKDTADELRLPAQGRATTFDALNIHIDPDRRSPAFAQIPASASVEVLAHKAVPRANPAEPLPVPSFMKQPVQPPAHKPHKSKQAKALSPRPPMPPPPKPPANWLDLSAERIDGPTTSDESRDAARLKAEKSRQQAAQPPKPVILEDWTLVRTKDRLVGWVLARNLYMGIPDEVAQYAEGQRITSYFDLGTVQDDEKGTKHHWLWTTLSSPSTFDFDRFRVFYWNRRRHRYETSYRQKDLTGYFPVELEPAQPGDPQRRFSLILQDANGNYSKKKYVFDGTLVHLAGTEPYQPASGGGPTKAAPLEVEQMEAKRPQPGFIRRQLEKLRKMWRR